MNTFILAIQLGAATVPAECELIRDGDHNLECADLALVEAENRLHELLLKVDAVTVRFAPMSMDGSDVPPDFDPSLAALAANAQTNERWWAYRDAECSGQNVTLDPDYTSSVTYKQCLASLTTIRIAFLERAFGPYFAYLEASK
jgi:Lysozyme inhibitor LprI